MAKKIMHLGAELFGFKAEMNVDAPDGVSDGAAKGASAIGGAVSWASNKAKSGINSAASKVADVTDGEDGQADDE